MTLDPIERLPKAYTAEEVQALTKVERWMLRRCGICHAPLFYIALNTNTPRFDGNCDCVSYYSVPAEESWQDIADTLNRNPQYQEQWIKELSGSQ